MCRVRSLVWIVASCIVALASVARAQAPKPGSKYYEDTTDLGFKVKTPDGWELIPPAPDDRNLIAKFDPASNKQIQLTPDTVLPLHMWLVKLDPPPAPESKDAAKEKKSASKLRVRGAKDLTEWIQFEMAREAKLVSTKEFEVDKVKAIEHVFSGGNAKRGEFKVFAVLFKLRPDADVALVFNGPGEAKRWSKYEIEFDKFVRTFRAIDVKTTETPVAAGDSLRDKRRAKLQASVATTPGWLLLESPSYFVVSNSDDREFLAELKERLEAIRKYYEIDYPAARVAEIRAAAPKTGDTSQDPDPGTEVQKSPTTPLEVSLEMSKTSVVRVCANREQYVSYGGPPSSAGFWNSATEELVLFDDKASGGRSDTWAVLNHEAFHQYIYYFYGNIAPHSWYNEGTGDFYSGYRYGRNRKFTLEKFDWRDPLIKESLREGRYVPLEQFVRMTKAEYYDQATVGRNYAQGWSLIYFLRTGKKNNAKGWNPQWDTILDTYLTALASTGKIDHAVEQAYAGVDMAELESAWIAYTR
jgi:hypothetical protein